MMIRFTLILSILLCSVAVSAEELINSLTKQLTHHPASDSVKVNLLNQLGYKYWIVNPAQSEILGKKALQLADSLRYLKGKAFANRIVGVSHWARGEYGAAFEYLFDGLTIYQQLNDKEGVSSSLNNIGLVYFDQQHYSDALKCFEQAFSMNESMDLSQKQAGILSNMGNTFLRLKDYAKAETTYQQVLQLERAAKHSYGIAEALSSIGELHLVRQQPQKALRFLNQSLAIRTSLPDYEGSAFCYYLIGKAYLAQKQYALAEQNLQKGIPVATRVNSLKWLTSIYHTLKDVEIARGNYQQAVKYFEAFTIQKDSLLNIENARQLAEMQTRFKTLEKDQKLQTQQKQLALLKEKSRLHVILRNTSMLGFWAVVIITYLIISRQRLNIRKNKELLEKNEEIFRAEQALAQAELENARFQELKLLEELESKNKKLTSYSLNFIQKNELMEEVKENLNQLKKLRGQEHTKELNGLNRLVENSMQIDKDWEDFKLHFEEVHKDFYRDLKDYYPDLTNNELKLCTLLKLNLNLKEAANIMGISPDSVKKARHRLRKKFGLCREENLIDHIISLEKHNCNIHQQVQEA